MQVREKLAGNSTVWPQELDIGIAVIPVHTRVESGRDTERVVMRADAVDLYQPAGQQHYRDRGRGYHDGGVQPDRRALSLAVRRGMVPGLCHGCHAAVSPLAVSGGNLICPVTHRRPQLGRVEHLEAETDPGREPDQRVEPAR